LEITDDKKFERETGLMSELKRLGEFGFPRIYYSKSDKYNYYMVMDRLNACLSTLVK